MSRSRLTPCLVSRTKWRGLIEVDPVRRGERNPSSLAAILTGKHSHINGGTLPQEIMPDFLHPGAEGYRLWAEAMEPRVKELLGE